MENRYKMFVEQNVFNIELYNKKVTHSNKLPYILVVIDEYADFVLLNKKINEQ